MYRLQVYDSRCQELLTQFNGDQSKNGGDSLFINSWNTAINTWGTLTFSINQFSKKASTRNLCPYNRLKLLRKNKQGVYEPVWCGYIESVVNASLGEFGTSLEIGAVGLEKMLRKRVIKGFNATGNGSDDVTTLLNQANAIDDTCICVGDMVPNLATNLTFDNTTMFAALVDIARASKSEFTVDENCCLSFVPLLGKDQSSVIQLVYNADGSFGGNARDIDRTQLGEDMINRVCATSDAGTVIKENPDSISKFGTLEGFRTFSNANDMATLCNMAESFVDQQGYPDISLSMQPEGGRRICPSGKCVGILYGDIELGDIVATKLNYPSGTEIQVQRVVEISTTVSENCLEDTSYRMAPTGVFATSSFFRRDEIEELRARLDALGG